MIKRDVMKYGVEGRISPGRAIMEMESSQAHNSASRDLIYNRNRIIGTKVFFRWMD